MDAEKIAKIFKDAGIEKEITCPQAFALAQKHKIPKMDVKIRGCQLGCFK
jgi:hypothetical protein